MGWGGVGWGNTVQFTRHETLLHVLLNLYFQILGLLQRSDDDSNGRICNVYELPLAASKQKGKPPPESSKRINHTRAFDDIIKVNASGLRTLLVADGAPCYEGFTKKHSLLLRQCNHSKGVWCV